MTAHLLKTAYIFLISTCQYLILFGKPVFMFGSSFSIKCDLILLTGLAMILLEYSEHNVLCL
jgi:hypothetical protein